MMARSPVLNKTANGGNGFKKFIKSSLRLDIKDVHLNRVVNSRFLVLPENESVGPSSTEAGSKKNVSLGEGSYFRCGAKSTTVLRGTKEYFSEFGPVCCEC